MVLMGINRIVVTDGKIQVKILTHCLEHGSTAPFSNAAGNGSAERSTYHTNHAGRSAGINAFDHHSPEATDHDYSPDNDYRRPQDDCTESNHSQL